MILLLAMPAEEIKFDEFAGGMDGRWVSASWHGQRIHCNATHFDKCLKPQAEISGKTVHWYGASQVHTVRYHTEGEQPSPYYTQKALPDINLLAMTEPNLNFQELYVFYKSLDRQMLPGMIVIPLVIDDLKEEGLRDGIRTLLFAKSRFNFDSDDFGNALLDRYETAGLVRTTALINYENNKFRGFRKTGAVQNYTETGLERFLDGIFPFTYMREQLMGKITVAFKRMTTQPAETVLSWMNNNFGISTPAMAVEGNDADIKKRSVFLDLGGRWTVDIPASVYDANFTALAALVTDARNKGIEVILYYQPKPQEPRWPYAIEDLNRFHQDVNDLCRNQGCAVYDLEDLVPDDYYGVEERNGKIVYDMFHFDIHGHEILGKAVSEIIQKELNL